MKTRHLVIIFAVLLIAYFVFFKGAGNPFAATDKSAAPGLLHSTRF
jgi:hypothetical protein